jgi:hypothetical protein
MSVAKNYMFDFDNDDKFEMTMLYSTGLIDDIMASPRASQDLISIPISVMSPKLLEPAIDIQDVVTQADVFVIQPLSKIMWVIEKLREYKGKNVLIFSNWYVYTFFCD